MSRERWGTFSVADHLRPRPFVAEVLLYDRLIIPCPSDDEDRARWTEIKRNPELLDRNLKILGDLAIPVPWDQRKREAFKTRFAAAKAAAFDTANIEKARQMNTDPLCVTRMLLAHDFLPPTPKGIPPLALAAYPSRKAYQDDSDGEAKEGRKKNLAMVLAHEFFVPEDPGKSDEDMLKQAVELAKRDDFKEMRATFNRWQEDVIEKGISANKAVEEMEEYLKEYNDVVKQAAKDVYLKYAFMVIPLAVGMATAPFGAPLVIAGAAGLLSIARFATFDRKPKIDAGECGAAAMIHDVQKNFNWA